MLHDGVPATLLHLHYYLKQTLKGKRLLFDPEMTSSTFSLHNDNTTVKTTPGTLDWLTANAFLNRPITKSCSWNLKVVCSTGGLNVNMGLCDQHRAKDRKWTRFNYEKGGGTYIVSCGRYVVNSTDDTPINATHSFAFGSGDEIALIYDIVNRTLTLKAITGEPRQYVLTDVPPGLYPVVILYGVNDQEVTITKPVYI
jgi:hypothetical protein